MILLPALNLPASPWGEWGLGGMRWSSIPDYVQDQNGMILRASLVNVLAS